MKIERLGRIHYDKALGLQEERLERCLNTGEETLLLLEHEPIYTIGRRPDKSSLGDISRLPYPVFETNRGGLATFHGPGQLVGYPIIDLRLRARDLHLYLRQLEELLIELLFAYGIAGSRVDGKTGVWIEDRKIASIGVGVRKWITMHGFAINVASDLSGFQSITPCGLQGVRMTSISLELGREILLPGVMDKLTECLERSPINLNPVNESHK
jgi:lipoyl(octanoyl) transferase